MDGTEPRRGEALGLMDRRHWKVCLAALMAVVIGLSGEVRGAEFDFSGGYALRVYGEKNNIDPLLSFFPQKLLSDMGGASTYDLYYGLLWAYGRMGVSFWDSVSLVSTVDSGVMTWQFDDSAQNPQPAFDGMTLKAATKNMVFVREAYLEWGVGDNLEMITTVGKKRTRLLDGLYYDDFGFKAGFAWDFWEGLGSTAEAAAQVLIPYHYFDDVTTDLMVMDASLSLREFPFDSLTGGVIWTRDRADLTVSMVREVLAAELAANQAWQQFFNVAAADFTGDMDVYTFYGAARLSLGDFMLSGLFAAQWGSGDVVPASPPEGVVVPKPKQARIDAHLTSLELEAPLSSRVTLTPFFLLVSGMTPGKTGDFEFTQFMTLVPYVEHLSIFLGGMNQLLTRREFGLLGMGSGGVSATGLLAEYRLTDRVQYGQSAAVLSTNRPRDRMLQGNYGVEVDNTLRVHLVEALEMKLEFDVLFPGDYFTEDVPVLKGIAGLEGSF